MLFAIINNEKILASPKMTGICPSCNNKVISKCGEKNIWHWAHENLRNCDSWSEGETEWHMNWKLAFGKEHCEIPIIKETKHIADIKTVKHVIIELQNSPIPSTVIRIRETFYGEKMIWIVNGFNFKLNFRLYPSDTYIVKKRSWLGTYNKLVKFQDENYDEKNKENNRNFTWDNPRRSWDCVTRNVFIDFGDETLFWIKEGMGSKCGSGRIVSKESFLKHYGGNLELLSTLIKSENK
jgi:hypothetical protein